VVMGQGTGIWVQVTLPSDMHVLRDKDTSVNNPSFNSPLHVDQERAVMLLPLVAVSRVAASREGLPSVIHISTIGAIWRAVETEHSDTHSDGVMFWVREELTYLYTAVG